MTMEGVNTTRLPSIVRFQVGGYATERESPERGWARIRTCLIDNPCDSGQNKRQEIWSYHKKNRGVLRSLVKSLPNIPFRIKRNKKRSHSDHELSSKNEKAESFLPKISPIGIESPTKNGKIRPLGTVSKSDDIIPIGKLKSVRNREDSAIRLTSTDTENLPATGVDGVEEQKRLETGDGKNNSEKRCESRLPRLLPFKQPLSKSRVVSFSTNDLRDSSQVSDRSDSRSSCLSEDSSNSEKGLEKVNFGHSSQHITEPIPRSVLDIITGNYLSDPRIMGDRAKRDRKTGTSETATFPGGNAEKEWFERVLGDKEIIDMSNYENFARTPRTRPINDSIPKYQNVLGASNLPDRKPKTVTSRSPLKVQFDIPSEEKPSTKPPYPTTYPKQAGEPIAAYTKERPIPRVISPCSVVMDPQSVKSAGHQKTNNSQAPN